MAYLMHFNRNHSRKDGRFVRGDGDGDGKPNDHINPTVGNKRLYTEAGKKVKVASTGKGSSGSAIVTKSSGQNLNEKDASLKNLQTHATEAEKGGGSLIRGKAEDTENSKDNGHKVTSVNLDKSVDNARINADGSVVQITSDGKVHIVNAGGVKNMKEYAIKQYNKEHPKIENNVGKDENPTMNESTPVSKVKSSSSGQSYTEKKKEEKVPTEEETKKWKAKVDEYTNRYANKSTSSTTSTKKSKVSQTYWNINL